MKYTKHWSCLKCFDAVGWVAGKGIRPVKRLSGGMLVWLSVWSEVQTYIWPSWCHCHSLSLASVKSRLVFPFWYRLTRVVPDKGPLNVCVWEQKYGMPYFLLTFSRVSELVRKTVKRPFIQDCSGELVPEETCTQSHPWWRRRMIHTYNKVHCVGAHPLECFEPTKVVKPN